MACYESVRIFQADLACDVLRCARVIARDHDNPYACGIAFRDGFCDTRTDRIDKAKESNELKHKIVLLFRQGILL